MSLLDEIKLLPSFQELDEESQRKVIRANSIKVEVNPADKEAALKYVDELVNKDNIWTFLELLCELIRRKISSDEITFDAFEDIFGKLDITSLTSIYRSVAKATAPTRKKRSRVKAEIAAPVVIPSSWDEPPF